jgi:hypothetical protein
MKTSQFGAWDSLSEGYEQQVLINYNYWQKTDDVSEKLQLTSPEIHGTTQTIILLAVEFL